MIFTNTDVFSQLQPRHVSRRERKPGARERHSTQRQRLQPDDEASCQRNQTKHRESTSAKGNKSSAYSMDSAITDFPQTSREKHEEVVVVSRFKELSTIEDIRANMKSTSRAKSAPPTRVPEWMLNLDINLDVTSLDIIPAFVEEPNSQNNLNETYTESPSFSYVDNESDNDDSIDDLEQTYLNNSDKENQTNFDNKADQRASSRSSNRLFSENITDKRRVMSNTFRIAESFSNKNHQQRRQHQQPEGSPRRYQGDKRVMSLQQGGIRSTPMQPKSKKFINQMITFHHMKHHDQKLKKAKPAIDTKMPSTFRYALERKQLVEQRLSQSWNQSEPTSPRKSPSPSKSPSNKSRDSR